MASNDNDKKQGLTLPRSASTARGGPPTSDKDVIFDLYEALYETCVCGEPELAPVLFENTALLQCKICAKWVRREN